MNLYYFIFFFFTIKTFYYLRVRFMILEFNESRTNLLLHVYQLTISWEQNK